ncbi:DedA family protein [Paenibacillus senegalensis]|uniref:DedA family protein n=1 Tax=Paenibacillus senegalensis TaxID=1465766 RepID=UPI000287A988|nr:DedA family protein [Paenibacillus senegalensis]
MKEWITEFMEQFGYLGILTMIAIENVFPPIPSEIILTFGGFMTTYSTLTVPGVIIAATYGSVLGAIVLYGIGRLLHVDRLEKWVGRWGHLLNLKVEDLRKADRWFQKYGYWTVLFCRMVPLVRSLISIPAGMAKMNFWLFLFFTVLGTVVWNAVLVIIGAAVGESWESILHYMDIYANVVYVLIALLLLVGVGWLIKKQRK